MPKSSKMKRVGVSVSNFIQPNRPTMVGKSRLAASLLVPEAKNGDRTSRNTSSSDFMEESRNTSELSKDKDALVASIIGASAAEPPRKIKPRRRGKKRKLGRSVGDCCEDHSSESGAGHLFTDKTKQQGFPLKADLQVSKAKNGNTVIRKLSSTDVIEEPKKTLQLSKDRDALAASVSGVSATESSNRAGRRRRRKNVKMTAGDCCGDNGLESGAQCVVSHETSRSESSIKEDPLVAEAKNGQQKNRKSSVADLTEEPKNISSLSRDENAVGSPINGISVSASPKRVKRRRTRRREICVSAVYCCQDDSSDPGAGRVVSHENIQEQSSVDANLRASEVKNGDGVIGKSSSSELMEKPKDMLRKDEDALIASDNGVSVSESSKRVKRRRNKKRKWCSSASGCHGDDSLESKAGCLISHETMRRQSSQESLGEAGVSAKKLPHGDLDSLPAMSTTHIFQELLNSIPPKSPERRSRKKLLILDINGLLADVVRPAPKWYKADFKIAGRAVFRRPSCYSFLKFCLERFDVAIWSSRSKKMVDRIVQFLLGDLKDKLIFCWDLSQCTESKFKTLENRNKAVVFKELRKIWEKYDPDLPWEKGDYDESNTLLIDDSPYKALLNPPNTAIFPSAYYFKHRRFDNSIAPGGDLRTYLEELAQAENVQEYIKDHPFGQSAITEQSSTWPFYEKVIGKLLVAATQPG